MEHVVDSAGDAFATLLEAERGALVRLCARLAGSAEAAEDLAQETLIEAWRQRGRLVDWSGARQWLSAIARFVCLRWRRRAGREWSRQAGAFAETDRPAELDDLAGDVDLSAEFDRRELALLIERALDLLPAGSRGVLLQRYVEERSHAEIAARLQVSEGAVAMRLQRSKQAFLAILSTRLRPEAAAFGWVDPEAERWTATRIWCPFCGAAYVQALRYACGSMVFRCDCADQIVGVARKHVGALKNLKTILDHGLGFCDGFYRDGLASGTVDCSGCGRRLPVRRRLGGEDGLGVEIHCPTCRFTDRTNLNHLTLDLPETRRFWRDHPRMRALPAQPCAFGPRPALLSIYASSDDSARIEVVSSADTLEVLSIGHSRGPLAVSTRSDP
ncbi:MAG TPA: RNA polymerase sigma factor [Herpetosiphonaceae bacterium]|nr:RNA polymerase sigma factor [Herpetosiphonaceae bacterium]